MASAISKGSSVEGEKLGLSTRQFFARPPVRLNGTKRIQYPFSLGIHGCAEITQAYQTPADIVVFLTSMTGLGDCVQGQSVDGWAMKPLGPPHIAKRTGTHSGTFVQVSGGCYAHIDVPSREYLQSAEIQKKHPEVTQVRRPVSDDQAAAQPTLLELGE